MIQHGASHWYSWVIAKLEPLLTAKYIGAQIPNDVVGNASIFSMINLQLVMYIGRCRTTR